MLSGQQQLLIEFYCFYSFTVSLLYVCVCVYVCMYVCMSVCLCKGMSVSNCALPMCAKFSYYRRFLCHVVNTFRFFIDIGRRKNEK